MSNNGSRRQQLRRIQTATSASRRDRRAKKPTVPWREARGTDIDPVLKAANPGMDLKWVRTWAKNGGTTGRGRLDKMQDNGWDFAKIPKNYKRAGVVDGNLRKSDCVLMALPKERAEARRYMIQEKSEAHLRKLEEPTYHGKQAKIEHGYLETSDNPLTVTKVGGGE